MGGVVKGFLGICLVLVSLILVVKLVGKIRSKASPAKMSKKIEEAKKELQWGVVLRPYALTVKTGIPQKWASPKKTLDSQLELAKELGVNHLRANFEDEEGVNDYIVKRTNEEGFVLTLIIDPKFKTDFFKAANYDLGYKTGKDIAGRYKGKVAYYQLANEATGVTIKKGFPGNKDSDYDTAKYKVFKEWVKGLSDGVGAGDPAAKRVISANWQGTAVMEMLANDGVKYEIIGWNWFADMGDIFNTKFSDGQFHNIPKELSEKLKKDFWIVESNYQNGSFKGAETQQAEYITEFVKTVKSHPEVRGLFVFTLSDIAENLNQAVGNWGLVKVKKNSDDTWSFNGKKPAFDAFKKAIK